MRLNYYKYVRQGMTKQDHALLERMASLLSIIERSRLLVGTYI